MRGRALLFGFAGIVATSNAVQACAAFGEGNWPVKISQEAAIIVWDAARQRQHFIRRASFQTKSRDVGFLVPTPATPELAEADDAAFARVGALMEPEKIEQIHRIWRFSALQGRRISNTFNTASLQMNDGGPADNVTMIFEQHVAGYDAVVLEAKDTAGLGRWLKSHGYHSSPAVLKWLKPYIEKRWKITAFKIPKGDKNSTRVSSTPVRMSFDTVQPFFPYSEPEYKQGNASRWLQVMFFAPQRMAGAVSVPNAADWGGNVTWADSLSVEKQRGLAKLTGLEESDFAAPQWLTVFNDYSSPRKGGDDVFFMPGKTQERMVPPPIVTYREQEILIPVDLMVIGGLFIFVFVSMRRASREEEKQ